MSCGPGQPVQSKDVGVAVDAEEDKRFWLESRVGEQSGQVLACLGVLGVVLDERAWPVVAVFGEKVFGSADNPL